MSFYETIVQPLGDIQHLDALVALDMIEEQEQAKEREFFRITKEIQEFGMEKTELEITLPELLKTRRERLLYNALMGIIRTEQDHLL
jgi:hypothetical protein